MRFHHAARLAGLMLLLAGTVRASEPIPDMPVTVYQGTHEALSETFPTANRFDTENRVMTTVQRGALEKSLGGPVADDTVTVHLAWCDTTLIGYGVVSEEIGKYRPITFLVGTTPELEVARVTVLVYRESHGADIRRTRFLNQYRGKDWDDPIRQNRDIINIAGATLSVRSLNFGVRKVLGILRTFYGIAP
ncbi:MAG: FMN-binding protein [Candidatus Eisenbacteria bacterium]|nr:FMN-binding protein [Candidatus Eisenbacteria bacterium]